MPSLATPSSAARPIDTATGTEMAKKISMETIINCDVRPPLDAGQPLHERPIARPACGRVRSSVSLLDSCLVCSAHRVVHGRRFACVEPAGEHAEYRQDHADGNGDVNPGNGKIQAGQGLEAHPPGHLCAHPGHEA